MPPARSPRPSFAAPSHSPRRGPWRHRALALALLLGASACDDDEPESPPAPEPAPRYEATIRRSGNGVPHITAKTLGSAAFGQGYAFAQDNVCTLADQILKVRSERARFLGPGAGNANVASDFGYLALGVHARAKDALPALPEDVRAMIQGYVAGYNHYLSQVEPAARPAACANAAWVRPIDDVDLMAYHISLALLSSSYQFVAAVTNAQPPTVTGGQRIDVPPPQAFQQLRDHDLGSNGWAIGAERSATGHGMLVANPHFPWQGELRLWESHLTVPDVMNVYGASLVGVPGVLIGFNDNVAWTHTVSAGQRMTLYRLKLVPGKPTHYTYDGQEREMVSRTHTILVRLPDGSLTNVSRTLYSSHFGPMLAIPGVTDWTAQVAYTYRDANLENTVLLAQFHAMNRARNLQEFKDAFATVQGIPWVNTLATDRDGNAWYTDAAATPNLSTAALDAWQQAISGADPVATLFFRNLNLVLLDGSTSVNAWVEAPGARSPGLVPFAQVPQLARRDFTYNANDSYWLTNPAQPLEGYSPLHGPARRSQQPRSRMNLVMLTEQSADGASGADGKFTLEELQAAILNNRSSVAELLRPQLVERCQRTPSATYQGKTVDLTQACAVLAAWNGRFDTDSVGAVLWREFIGTYPVNQLLNKGTLFDTAFDLNAPFTTPSTLTPAPAQGEDPALVKLAQAVTLLGTAKIAVDAPLGTVQFAPRAGLRIPIHGGHNRDGVANVAISGTLQSSLVDPVPARGTVLNGETGLSTNGYVVSNGSSFILALAYTATGVDARALLTYGQSGDPASPYFTDQTQRFSQKQWRTVLFNEADILADPALTQQVVSAQ
ncbi:acylase [Corallococcus interemptor]|uniref:acylase n=1 Tax=Corallococcus interemptor TaxID=2316720 RepID=UPI0035D3ECFD